MMNNMTKILLTSGAILGGAFVISKMLTKKQRLEITIQEENLKEEYED